MQVGKVQFVIGGDQDIPWTDVSIKDPNLISGFVSYNASQVTYTTTKEIVISPFKAAYIAFMNS